MKVETLPLGELGANCYFVTINGETAVIDPGADVSALREKLAEYEGKVKYILLTHRHADHVMGTAAAKRLTGAQVVISQADAEGLSDPRVSLANVISRIPQECLTADMLVDEGDTLPLGGEELRVMATPGHTVGGVCFLIGDALFSGDTLFRENCGRTDLPTGDYPTILRSLARLAALEGDYTVYPGHDMQTTLEHERKHNPYMNTL